MDIEFTFSKIGQEEMRLISGGMELKDKWQRTISSFTQNFDKSHNRTIEIGIFFQNVITVLYFSIYILFYDIENRCYFIIQEWEHRLLTFLFPLFVSLTNTLMNLRMPKVT